MEGTIESTERSEEEREMDFEAQDPDAAEAKAGDGALPSAIEEDSEKPKDAVEYM